MLVRFIAHAGIAIEEDGHSILIDPWFLDSTPEEPVIESIGGGFKTIDFQIPKTTEVIENYAPDAILVSHFHPHHAPARDICILFENALAKGKVPQLFHPAPSETAQRRLIERVHPDAKRIAMEPGDEWRVGPFTITAKEHTNPYHRVWLVTSPTGTVLHIGDGRLHRDEAVRMPDTAWEKLRGLAPSVLFLSTGGHALRVMGQDGERRILDGGIMSPVEAALVTQIIAPKTVAGFGFYNHSIWKNRLEYILPASINEEQFEWALSWLSPEIRNVRLVPGHTFGIGDATLRDSCATYLPS